MSSALRKSPAEPRNLKKSLEEALPEIYQELKKLAAAQLRGSRNTLVPTSLVHEVFLRLQKRPDLDYSDRAQFFGLAAQCMRWLITDYARKRFRDKATPGVRVTLAEDSAAAPESDVDIIALNEAIEALAKQDPALAKVVEMRYFVGLGVPETAAAMGISERTVKRHWALAKAWLKRAVEEK